MKYSMLPLAFIFIFFTMSLFAQVHEINNIRATYNAYNELIQQQGEDSNMSLPLKIEITSTVTERAIGPVKRHIILYYDRLELHETDNFSFSYTNNLRKVVMDEKSGFQIHREFLFDSAGKLIFSYMKAEGYWPECSEQRFYFKEGKLIRVVYNENPDFMGDSIICDSGTRDNESLTEDDIKAGHEVMKMGTKFQSMLHQLTDF
jgi:hypothetical protein